MIDLDYCRRLARKHGRYPITIERYDSGQVGFIARPMHNGRRHNCAFSTSRYPNPEEAAAAAIEFCKAVEKGEHASRLIRRERYRIPAGILPELSELVKVAIEQKQDPVAILRDGLVSDDRIRPQLSRLVNQAMQLRVDPVKVLSNGIQAEIRKRLEETEDGDIKE